MSALRRVGLLLMLLVPGIAPAQDAPLKPVNQPTWETPWEAEVLEGLEEEAPPDEPSWQATGDELWDAYVAAIEEQLDVPPPRGEITAPGIDDALLAKWEPRFGSDPRYWQLRYWNATYSSSLEEVETEIDPIEFVRRGAQRSAVDPAALWLIYRADVAELDALEERLTTGAASAEDTRRLAESGLSTNRPYEALTKLREQLATDLSDKLPDQSRPWYERAFRRIEVGDWEAGLEFMERGNAAKHNSKLDPYPLSFVKSKIISGEPVGSAAVAGTVMLQTYSVVLIPNFIRPKDHTRELQIRLNMGGDLSEVGIWHRWAMRSALMEGADGLDRLVMVVISGMLTKHLLVDMADALTVEQRDDLWSLNHRIRGVAEISRRKMDERPELAEYLSEHLSFSAGELAEQMLQDQVWPPTDEDITVRIEELRELLPDSSEEVLRAVAEGPGYSPEDYAIFELRRLMYEWSFAYATEEYAGESAQKSRERFERALDFDFSTLRWKEEPAAAETIPPVQTTGSRP